MSISGDVAAVPEPRERADAVAPPGSQGALDALAHFIAAELAAEYIDRMEAAAMVCPGSAIEAHPTSHGPP
jgi:hypothetical protein